MPSSLHLPITTFISPVSKSLPSPSYPFPLHPEVKKEEGKEDVNTEDKDGKYVVEEAALDYIDCEIVKGSSPCGFTIPNDRNVIAKHLKAHSSAGELFKGHMGWQECPFHINGKKCGMGMKTVRAFSTHLIYTHFGLLHSPKVVTCPLCGKVFSRPGNLKRHRIAKHIIAPLRSMKIRESLQSVAGHSEA